MLGPCLAALSLLSAQVESDAALGAAASDHAERPATEPSSDEPPPAAPAPRASKPRLVVTDLIAERGLDAGLVRLLNEMMLTELSDRSDYTVIGGSDVNALLEGETQRQMLGICDDINCLTELGGALNARVIVSANIGVIGERYLINLKLIDVAESRVIRRISRAIPADETMLLPEMRSAVHELATGEVVAAAAPRDEPAPPPSDDGPSGLGLTLLRAGGVVGALGAVVVLGGALTAAAAEAALLDQTADPALRTTALTIGAPALLVALGGGVVALIGVGLAGAGGVVTTGSHE